jgi:hypothetical protein
MSASFTGHPHLQNYLANGLPQVIHSLFFSRFFDPQYLHFQTLSLDWKELKSKKAFSLSSDAFLCWNKAVCLIDAWSSS